MSAIDYRLQYYCCLALVFIRKIKVSRGFEVLAQALPANLERLPFLEGDVRLGHLYRRRCRVGARDLCIQRREIATSIYDKFSGSPRVNLRQ